MRLLLVPCGYRVLILLPTIWVSCVVFEISGDSQANAQDKSKLPTVPAVVFDDTVLNEPPFDLITVKEDAGGGQAKVFPLSEQDRAKRSNPDQGAKLVVKMINYPDRNYEVRWKDIERIDFYEELVLAQAKKRMEDREYAAAFEHLQYLLNFHPSMSGLRELRSEFLLTSAQEMFQQKRYEHTLTVLEEHLRIFPSTRTSQVIGRISDLADKIIQKYMDQGELKSAKEMIARLDRDYKNNPLPSVQAWKARFRADAEALRDKAIAFRDQGDLRSAREIASSIMALDDELPDGRALLEQLIDAYPMIRIAVFEPSFSPDPASLFDWPARRAGALISRPLFQFRSTGSEGGQYRFMFGSFSQSEDRKSFEMDFRKPIPGITANPFNVSQWMLRKADPNHTEYRASWAAILRDVSVPSPDRLEVRLRQPHVLPHALAQWQIDELVGDPSSRVGLYERRDRGEFEVSYMWTEQSPRQTRQPIEIVERRYTDPQKAISDFIRGDLEIIDHLYPADAEKLKDSRGVQVDYYALPTVHMLVPFSDHAYVNETNFRRALLLAVNRQALLQDELLGGRSDDRCKLISGPFPLGASEKDPLNYAYNTAISPHPFDRTVAKFLVELTQKELAEAAKRRKQPEPQLTPIRIGVPDFELAKTAVEAMVQQWQLLQIPAEVHTFEPGIMSCPRGEVDLLYVSAAIWEPATDAERLLGEDGIAATTNPYIVQTLARLRSSRNWREVRQSLQDLHSMIHYHLPVLPLWQIGDAFAYRQGIQGIARQPLNLYQDLEQWRNLVK